MPRKCRLEEKVRIFLFRLKREWNWLSIYLCTCTYLCTHGFSTWNEIILSSECTETKACRYFFNTEVSSFQNVFSSHCLGVFKFDNFFRNGFLGSLKKTSKNWSQIHFDHSLRVGRIFMKPCLPFKHRPVSSLVHFSFRDVTAMHNNSQTEAAHNVLSVDPSQNYR